MSLSRSSILQAADAQAGEAQRQGYADPISVVYQIIRDHAQTTGQVRSRRDHDEIAVRSRRDHDEIAV